MYHKTCRTRALLVTTLFVATMCAQAQTNLEEQATKEVSASRGSGIVVDGVPQEPSWRAAKWHSGFTMAGAGELSPVQTRFAVCFDDTFLYLAAVADEPDPAAIRRQASERDTKIFRDDCIEFMVDPTGDRVEYYHFAVSASGALYDSQCRQGGHVASKEWDSSSRVMASVQENSFSVEMAIPFVELGLAPRSASQPWAIQVARERHAGGNLELSSYMGSGGSFHVPSTYAPLILKGAALGRFLWDVKAPLEDLVTSENGRLVYQSKALITNGTGRFRFTSVKAELRGAKGTTQAELTGGHDDGQQQPYVFRVPVPNSGQYSLVVSVADRQHAGEPLAVRSQTVSLNYSPLRIVITRPFYRKAIYATERLKAIEADIDLRLPSQRLGSTRLEGRLFAGSKPVGKPVATGSVTTDTSRAALSVPISNLAEGTYLLRVTATVGDGEVFTESATIRKLPPVDNEWRIDENLALLRNGKPFFPYGWFSGPASEALSLRTEGVTAVQAYNAQYYPPEKTLGWLDQLHEHGLVGTFYPWPSSTFMKNFRQPVSEAEEATLRERIRAFRDHPALLAYYMWDEPELRPMLVERSDRLYEIIAEEDPYHPCIMLNDTIPGIHKYRNGGDILMPDPYPLFNKGGLAGRPIEYTSKFMLACREASRGKKAWWVTPQAFDYYMNKKNSRPPNLTELRNQQLQAIINGARGILWYTHSHRHNYEELDYGVPFLGREAERLRAPILAPELDAAVTWETEETKHIQATVRRVGGDTYLFAVNTRTASQEVTFQLTDADVNTLYVVSENRSVQVTGGRFNDRFELYEGHVYTTSKSAASGQTVAETRKRLEEAKKLRHKPGNLAYRELGATVTVSSKSPYSGMLSMVVDGKVKGKGWKDKTWKKWPDWIQVTLAQAATVGRVVVYTRAIVDYEILLEDEGRLSKVAEGTRSGEDPITATFEPQIAEAVRIVAKSGTGTGTSVSEIEVYAR